MRLTTFSDYAFRLLLYAAAAPERLVTIEEAARAYNISRAHLMKVANLLVQSGFLTAVRGRSGGLRLARSPDEINLGDVVRSTEPDFALVECFATGNECQISQRCKLPDILNEALSAFVGTLAEYTLADIVLNERDMRSSPNSGRTFGVRGPALYSLRR